MPPLINYVLPFLFFQISSSYAAPVLAPLDHQNHSLKADFPVGDTGFIDNLQGRGQRTWKNWAVWQNFEKAVNQKTSRTALTPLPPKVPSGTKSQLSSSTKFTFESYGSKGKKSTMSVKIGSELGKGAYGAVYEGSLSASTFSSSKPVAIKMSTRDTGGLITGAKLQQSITSNNVATVLDYFYVSKSAEAYVIMEKVAGGDLHSATLRLYREGKATLKTVFLAVIEGVMEIHAKDIMHRDLKPENILLDGNNPKLADFDSATIATTSIKLLGSPGYMAPEILRLKEYTKSVDVFSLGAIWMFISRAYLHRDMENFDEFYRAIIGDDVDKMLSPSEIDSALLETFGAYITEELRGLMSKVLCMPSHRLDVNDFYSRFREIDADKL